MPTSRHRKSHKQKKAQRRAAHELKRHRTQVFASKLEDMIKNYKAEEESRQLAAELPQITGYTPLPSQEIFPNDFSII